MANGIRTGDPCGFNKGCSPKFHEGSQVRQLPEEGRRTYWLKRFLLCFPLQSFITVTMKDIFTTVILYFMNSNEFAFDIQ